MILFSSHLIHGLGINNNINETKFHLNFVCIIKKIKLTNIMVEIIIKTLNKLSTLQRRLILIFIDILIIFLITHNKFLFNSNYFNFGFYGFLLIFIILTIYLFTGQYQGITNLR